MLKFLSTIIIICILDTKGSQIAVKKCEEYGKAVYLMESAPVMSVRPQMRNVSTCGIVSVPLIVGGTKCLPKEFPHMALIRYGRDSWECGGSLISELYILTAAHCMESRENGFANMVRVGTIHLHNDLSHVQDRAVARRIPHPKYDAGKKHYDIALLKMAKAVEFTAYVRPACLPARPTDVNKKPVAIGFGKTSYAAVDGSMELMKVALTIYDGSICSRNLQLTLIDSMICAGDLKGGKDTCGGDSGGPIQLVLKTPYCMYEIIGITSFGRFCGFANSPAVYTNVYSFLPWIENIIWPN